MVPKSLLPWYYLATLAAVLPACAPKKPESTDQNTADKTTADTTKGATPTLRLTRQPFGTTPDGSAVDLFTLENGAGMTVRITNLGGIVTSIRTPDRAGKPGEVTLGFDSLAGYTSAAFLKANTYFGALIGRYGNRIANGKFTLGGKVYTLATNNHGQHLHGGNRGFDKVVWQAQEVRTDSAVGVQLTYRSPDGEEGYPGNLTTTVQYSLGKDNALRIDYTATTDRPTPLNLTNHTYFNLAADSAADVLSHQLTLAADRYTVVDARLIPTGELRAVRGTPMDFTQPQAIGARLAQVPGGYDHNYVLNHAPGAFGEVVSVSEPLSGRTMRVLTDQPGVQFYSGNFLDGALTGHDGRRYGKHAGFCLETQHFPDSPNQPGFPSVVLQPGQTFRSRTEYHFSAK